MFTGGLSLLGSVDARLLAAVVPCNLVQGERPRSGEHPNGSVCRQTSSRHVSISLEAGGTGRALRTS